MKGKTRKGVAAGGSSGSGGGSGIVVEATNRKARRKEQRHAKKKQHQLSKPRRQEPVVVPVTNASDNGVQSKKKKKLGGGGDDDGQESSKRVKFSNNVQEKTIPSVKNHIPTGLKKSSSRKSSSSSDDHDTNSHSSKPNSRSSSHYNNLDDETAAAFRKDDMEIEYLASELGYKNSKKGTKELNREYAKNEGYGEDFGEFLMGLDDLVDRCVGEDGDSDGSEDESGGSDNNEGSESDEDNLRKKRDGHIIDSEEEEEDDDGSIRNDSGEDPYANLDEDTALALRNDDAEIAALEDKLGLAKSSKAKKKLNKEFASTYGEDFGDFLDGMDQLGEKLRMGGDYDSLDDASMGSDDSSDDQNGVNGDNESKSSKGEDSEESDEEEELEDMADHDVSLTYRPTSGEDIYGNKIDASQNDSVKPTKYVPPHLRKKLSQENPTTVDDNDNASSDASNKKEAIAADPEILRRINRQLNNTLNRLSSNTLESVSKQISSLYSQYPFHDVNDCLWKNIVNTCVPPHMIMSGMIPLYIGSMAGVHWLGGDGIQLGGNLIEWSVAKLYESLKKDRVSVRANGQEVDQQDMINKEASNLLLIVCYLYNYGVIHCTLIYDLVRDFIGNFTEIDVEALLIILSHCGQQLRSDDPSALREIVLLVKDRATQKVDTSSATDFTEEQDKNVAADSSRIQFMVDTIIELKNNKPRKADVIIRDTTNALKKCIGRVKTSASQLLAGKKSGSCLRVTLQDVLDADTKGRWWMVGASWAGNQFRGDATADNEHSSLLLESEESSSKKTSNNEDEDSLLALASSQRMNTDARRSIFCIVMGSTDCDDAFEKLVRQGLLKPKAERDVVRVIVHCCGEEKAYNPFYAYLAMRICEYQHKSRFTLMLTFWDAFKQVDGYSVRKVANLAKLLGNLIGGGDGDSSGRGGDKCCLNIGVLKRIDFSPSDMSEMTIVLLSIFMTDLFESCVVEDVQRIFAHGSTTATADSSSSSSAKKKQHNVDSDDDDSAASSDQVQTTKKEDLSDLRESLSIFLLQYIKSSPKNVEGTDFHSNLLAAISTCDHN